jgi:hypothetical protein
LAKVLIPIAAFLMLAAPFLLAIVASFGQQPAPTSQPPTYTSQEPPYPYTIGSVHTVKRGGYQCVSQKALEAFSDYIDQIPIDTLLALNRVPGRDDLAHTTWIKSGTCRHLKAGIQVEVVKWIPMSYGMMEIRQRGSQQTAYVYRGILD